MGMTFDKLKNRIRKRIAAAINARPTLPTRATHSAYPETQISDDGTWIVRFYSYEPTGWVYQGEEYDELPVDYPEPELKHPTAYAEGCAPSQNVDAWRQYYNERPQAITFIEELEGKSASHASAVKAAYRALQNRVDHYRRTS